MKKFLFTIFSIAALVIICGPLDTVMAQGQAGDRTQSALGDSTVTGFLPALGYSSDIGFAAGGLVSRLYYRDGFKPYYGRVHTAALVTTKGLFSFMIQTDQMETLGYKVRTQNKFNVARVLETTWFGVGNNTTFNNILWEDGYYFYESYLGEYELRVRKRLWDNPNDGSSYLDLQYLSLIRTIQPQIGDSGSLFADQQVPNSTGSWAWVAGLGLHWENRDNEIAPTRGNTAVVDFMVGPGLIADHQMWWGSILLTQYYTQKIIFPVTLALRGAYYQTGGDVPFYMYPELGGEYTVRGLAQGRFRDDAMLHYTVELRTWLIQLPQYGFRLGGQLFADGGRVYETERIYNDFFQDHKRTLGLGAAMSLFTYDFLIRADLGFSDEISRMYFGIGYTF
jgi:outer membrane protein assembly factor BamA